MVGLQDPLQSSSLGYSALTRATRVRVPVAEFVEGRAGCHCGRSDSPRSLRTTWPTERISRCKRPRKKLVTSSSCTLCCDATLVPPVQERTLQAGHEHPELQQAGPQRLVVLGAEVGGRWSASAVNLVRHAGCGPRRPCATRRPRRGLAGGGRACPWQCSEPWRHGAIGSKASLAVN